MYNPNQEVKEDDLPGFLYDKTQGTLDEMIEKFTRVFGGRMISKRTKEEVTFGSVEFGWAYFQETGDKLGYFLVPTELGKEIANNYLERKGLGSLEVVLERKKASVNLLFRRR